VQRATADAALANLAQKERANILMHGQKEEGEKTLPL
jgi:hypothetical protein